MLKILAKNHPKVTAIKCNGLTHIDEPYFFLNAYLDYKLKPLLYAELDQLVNLKKEVDEKIIYVSWIKCHGKGRVFHSSPSHKLHSLDNTELLQFFLDGMQCGDLECDDSPIGKK